MSEWIATDTLDLAKRRGKKAAPKKVHLMLSPYDVPNAVRSYRENENLIIEFRYIEIRESKSPYLGPDDGISFIVGNKTRRIYKIVLDHEKFLGDEINILMQADPIDSAIDEFISHQEKESNTVKYSATQSALRDFHQCLVAGV